MSLSYIFDVNFKLQYAPATVADFSIPTSAGNRTRCLRRLNISKLVSKLDEFNLNMKNVYVKDSKRRLIPLNKCTRFLRAGDSVKLFAVVDLAPSEGESCCPSESKSSSSSDSDDNATLLIDKRGRSSRRPRRPRSRNRDDERRSQSPSRKPQN